MAGGRYKNRDADERGAARYHIPVTHPNSEITQAQQRLKDAGLLKSDADVDGCIGRGTLSAIAQWEKKYNRDFYTNKIFEVKPAVEISADSQIDGLPNFKQFLPPWGKKHLGMCTYLAGQATNYLGQETKASQVARWLIDNFGFDDDNNVNIDEFCQFVVESGGPEISPDDVDLSGAKTYGQIGCLCTNLSMIASKYLGREVLPTELGHWLDIHDGFDGTLLRWEKVCEFIKEHGGPSLVPKNKIALASVDDSAGLENIASIVQGGTPVLLRVAYEKGEGYRHFVLCKGFQKLDDGMNLIFNDPGAGDNSLNSLNNNRHNYGVNVYDYLEEVA